MADKLWTVARFPSGDWSTGGRPTSPEYARCDVWQVEAASEQEARRKAYRLRARGVAPVKRAEEAPHAD